MAVGENRKTLQTGGSGAGVALIVFGIALLMGRLFDFSLGAVLWPFWVIVPGVALLALGLSLKNGGDALSILGGMVSVTGLILFSQNLIGHWQIWAYAWALVAPLGAGLGLGLYGMVHDAAKSRQDAMQLIKIGLIMFLVGAVFFELVIGISGFGLGRLGWPVLLIGLGVIVLIRNIWSKRG